MSERRFKAKEPEFTLEELEALYEAIGGEELEDEGAPGQEAYRKLTEFFDSEVER